MAKPDVPPKSLWNNDEENVVGPENKNPYEAFGEMQAEGIGIDQEQAAEILAKRRQELKEQIKQELSNFESETKEDLDRINKILDDMHLESDFILDDIRKLEATLQEVEALKKKTTAELAGEAKAEKKESREQILDALNNGLKILKNLPQTDRIKWVIQAVEEARDQALGSDDLFFEVSAKGQSQREGIPVDDLMEELAKIVKEYSAQNSEAEKNKASTEADEKKAEEEKMQLELLKKKATDLKARQEQILQEIGAGGPDPEHQINIAWHRVFNELPLIDPLRQWVDGVRKHWAQLDKENKNPVPVNAEGNDYETDSDFFALQTGEALKQAADRMVSDQNDARIKALEEQIKKLDEEIEKMKAEAERLAKEQAQVQEILDVLERNSKGYFELRLDMQGEKQHWRTELEAKLIQLDIRSTGDLDKDYQLAMEAMNKRRELILQKEPAVVPEGEIDITEPEWITQESTPVEPEEVTPEKVAEAVEIAVAKKGFIIDISEVVQAMAWRIAEQRKDDLLRLGQQPEAPKEKGFFRRIASASRRLVTGLKPTNIKSAAQRSFVRLGERGYLLKMYEEAQQAIVDNKDLMADIKAALRSKDRQYVGGNMDDTHEMLNSVIREYEHEAVQKEEMGETITNTEINVKLAEIFYEFASNPAMTDNEFNAKVEQEVIPIIEASDSKFTTDNTRTKGARGLMYANNLLEIAKAHRGNLDLKAKKIKAENPEWDQDVINEWLKSEMKIDLQLGLKYRDLMETKPQGVCIWYETMSNAIEKGFALVGAENVGKKAARATEKVINPLTVGIVGGFVGKYIFRKAARPLLGAIGVGALVGGIAGALRRVRDVQYDHGMDQRRATLGAIEGGPRTREMRTYNYDQKEAEDIIAKLREILAGGQTEFGALSDEEKAVIADTISRLEVERQQHVDLIKVKTEEGEKFKSRQVSLSELRIALKQVKDKLQLIDDNGDLKVSELETSVKADEQALLAMIAEKDQEFSGYKFKESLKSGAEAAVFGGTIGGIFAWLLPEASHFVGEKVGKAVHSVHDYMSGHNVAEAAVAHGAAEAAVTQAPVAAAAEHLTNVQLPNQSFEIKIPDFNGSHLVPVEGGGFNIMDAAGHSHGLLDLNQPLTPEGIPGTDQFVGLPEGTHLQPVGDHFQILDSNDHVLANIDAHGHIDPDELAKQGLASREIIRTTTITDKPAEVFKQMGDKNYGQHLRVDWHDNPGKEYSQIFHKMVTFEGKQQMLFLSQAKDGTVTVDAKGILENLTKNASHIFKEFGTNPDGTVDHHMKDLYDAINGHSSADLAKELQVVVIPDQEASEHGMNYLISENTNGLFHLPKMIGSLFHGSQSLHDGHLPVKHIEVRFQGHTLATVSGKELGSLTGEITSTQHDILIPTLPEVSLPTPEVPPIIESIEGIPFTPAMARRKPLEAPGKKEKGEKQGKAAKIEQPPAAAAKEEEAKKSGGAKPTPPPIPGQPPAAGPAAAERVAGTAAATAEVATATAAATTAETAKAEKGREKRKSVEEILTLYKEQKLDEQQKENMKEWLSGIKDLKELESLSNHPLEMKNLLIDTFNLNEPGIIKNSENINKARSLLRQYQALAKSDWENIILKLQSSINFDALSIGDRQLLSFIMPIAENPAAGSTSGEAAETSSASESEEPETINEPIIKKKISPGAKLLMDKYGIRYEGNTLFLPNNEEIDLRNGKNEEHIAVEFKNQRNTKKILMIFTTKDNKRIQYTINENGILDEKSREEIPQ